MSVFIEKITIKNLLSFDEEGITDFELKPLNVLIGANASGKSNFISALRILTKITNRNELIDALGGADELAWKGAVRDVAEIGIKLNFRNEALVYKRIFDGVWFYSEQLGSPDVYDSNRNNVHIKRFDGWSLSGRDDFPKGIKPRFGLVSARGNSTSSGSYPNFDPTTDTVILHLPKNEDRALVGEFQRIYETGFLDVINVGNLRTASQADAKTGEMRPDGTNLGVYLGELHRKGLMIEQILESLQHLYPQVQNISIYAANGRVHVMVQEKGMRSAMLQAHLSDGMLRLLTYLMILNQESPPLLLCIEEPENGFHPDVLRVLAKALKEASQRTQIIVTTHSPDLLGYMEPEDVVVCERGEKGGTQMRRLNSETLKDWLKDYDLGQLWLSGELGGTRY